MRYTAKNRRLRTLLIASILLVALAACIVAYRTGYLPFIRSSSHRQTSGSPYTKGEPSTGSQPAQPPASSSEYSQDKGQDNTIGTESLTTPSGTFVSNHHPHLSNNPAGSGYLASNCTTTPGAMCTITFTMNGVSKSLPGETTDAGGSAYWNNWRPQDYGITAGTWTIQAVVRLGSQTKTADDALPLEVSP